MLVLLQLAMQLLVSLVVPELPEELVMGRRMELELPPTMASQLKVALELVQVQVFIPIVVFQL